MTTDVVVKSLAVVGSGVLGGVGLSLLGQLLSRAFTTRPLPRWPVLTIRLLGGGVCGWLVALWLFGGGGSGIGGSGGWGFGSGNGNTEKTSEDDKKRNDGKKRENAALPDGDKLRVEVLNKGILERLGSDEAHCYRVHVGGEPQLKTRQQVEQLILDQPENQPSVRYLEIVVYKEDSPAEDNPTVRQLRDWARKQRVKGGGEIKAYVFPGGEYAPEK